MASRALLVTVSLGLWTTTAASQTPAASAVATNIPPLFPGDRGSASQPIGEIPPAPLKDVSPAISISLVATDLASSSLGAMDSLPSSDLEATNTTFTTSSEQQIGSSSNHVQNSASNYPPVAKTFVYNPSSEASFRLLPSPHKTDSSSAPAGLPYQILSPPTVPGVPGSTHMTPNGSLSPATVSMKAYSTHSPRSTSGPPTSSSISSKTVRMAPDPRTASSKRGTAFHLYLELMPWIEARKYCRAVHSDLASVPTTDVQMAITELLAGTTAAQRGAWLGLRKNRFLGNWYWVNDEAFDFSYWHEGEPSNQVWEQCGMVSANPGRNFSWADECCAARLPAICYSEL
ncbi:uncharacterized protein [Ambystoma mexicanum]|uniref:uncharacterized protein n=1 Tax=Ambystoma mexicanum TaxID=8296 RepID=UPI0037E869BC